MKLLRYRKQADLSQAGLADLLTRAGFPASQALVSQWETGAVAISAERAVQIERVTGGGVSRADLRPDLFGEPSSSEVADCSEAPPPARRSPAAPPGGAAADNDEPAAPAREVA